METYLGDGVYCKSDGVQYTLYTQEGQAIFLEATEIAALNAFKARVDRAMERQNESNNS